MGGAKKVFKSVASVFGGGGSQKVSAPKVPDYEAARAAAEAEALRKRGALADKGMSGTILGGSYGDDEKLKKKKLLGE